MIQPLIRAELWTDYRCRSGQRIGVIPLTREDSCKVTHSIERLLAVKRVNLTIPDNWEHAAEVIRDRVVTLVYIDNSTAAGAFYEYRIENDDAGAGTNAGRIKVLGLDPILDLAREEEIITAQYSGSITQNLTSVLSHAPSIFVAGTVTPTHGAVLNLEQVAPVDALQQLLEFANGGADIATGQQYLGQAIRNGVTNYQVHVTELGSGADLPDIRERKNLTSLTRRRTRQDVFTRLYMFAQGQPLGDAWFTVTAVDTDVSIDIAVENFPDHNPIYKDGAYAAQGLYWWHEDGVAHAITNESRANKRLFMASTTGIAVGERGRFARNSTGDPVLFLDDPDGARPIFSTLDVDVSPGTNWLPNPRFEFWQGTTPDVPEDWDDEWLVPVAGEWQEETTDTLFGSAALAANDGAIYFLRPHGDGWSSTGKTFSLREGDTVSYSLWFKATTAFTAAVAHFGNPNTGATEGVSLGGNEPGAQTAGIYQSVHRNYIVETTGNKTLQFVVFKQGTQEYIIAGGLIGITPKGQVVPTGFFEGSPGALAWVLGVNKLLNQGGNVYDVSILDLSRYDDATWPFDRLELGADVTLTSGALALNAETLKVVQLEVNELNPVDSKVTLATRYQTLTSQLFAALQASTGNPVTVGNPVNLEPGEPPPPPPPPATSQGPFVLVGSTAGFPQGRSAAARGGTVLHDGGAGGALGIRSPKIYVQTTDPTLEDEEDVADGDIWKDEVATGVYLVYFRASGAWTALGYLVPDDGAEDEILTADASGHPVWAAAGAGSFAPSFLSALADDITHTSETEQPVEYDTLVDSSGSDLSLASGTVVFAKAGLYLINAQCYVTIPPASGTVVQFDFYGTAMNTVGNDIEITVPLTGLEQDPMVHAVGLLWVDTATDAMEMRALMRFSGSPGSCDSWGHRILVCGPLLEL